jgi:hypothetical protein
MALIVRRPSSGHKGVAPLSERSPEAEASVKGATWPSSHREHRPANGEGSSAFRQENQAFPWKWLIQRIEPLPVERALARSRQGLALDGKGRSLGMIRVPRATPAIRAGLGGPSPRPPSLTNRGVANTRARRIA